MDVGGWIAHRCVDSEHRSVVDRVGPEGEAIRRAELVQGDLQQSDVEMDCAAVPNDTNLT